MDGIKFFKALKPRKLSQLNFPVIISTEQRVQHAKIESHRFHVNPIVAFPERTRKSIKSFAKKASHSKLFIPVITDRYANFSKYFQTVKKILEAEKNLSEISEFSNLPLC